jgi:hypothetical protein
MKRFRIHICIFISVSAICIKADFFSEYGTSNANLIEQFDTTSIVSEELLNAYLEAIDDPLPRRALPAIVIIQLLLDLGAIELLQQDFFLHTNRINKRGLATWPIFEYQTALLPAPNFFRGELFLNVMPRAYLTASSSNMKSYLATQEETLLEKIEALINAVKELSNGTISNINIRTILDIVGNIRVEERNIGCMFQGGGRWERIQLRVLVPLLYHERNFFLKQAERDTLAQELGFTSEETFEDEHAIADRLGVGDTRIEFGIHAVDTVGCQAVLGVLGTVPTAFSFVKGLAGRSFYAPNIYPRIDFDTLYQCAEDALNGTITPEEQAHCYDIFQSFVLEAFNRLAAALIEDSLGNQGHFGLGFLTFIDAPLDQWVRFAWAERWHWHTNITLEYLFPARNTRFFIEKNNPAAFQRNFLDPEQQEQNLRFLENEIIAKTFLLGLTVDVQPGIIGTWTSSFVYTDPSWHGYIGTNIWFQTKEHQQNIATDAVLLSTLDLVKAIPPSAFQSKLVGGFSYTFENPCIAVTLGFDGDAALWTSGIGYDYTAALRIEARF